MKADSGADADVIVIGGGLHGTSSALHLARKGLRVTLLEADYCGRHASGVNAGGVRTLGRHIAEIPLALASLELWHRLADLTGDDAGFVPSGQLKVAETDAELDLLRRRVAQLEALGFTHETLVDAHTVRALVPSIAPHVTGAIWASRDGHALPYRAVTAFRRAAAAAGAVVHEATTAGRLEYAHGRWHVHTPRGVFRAKRLVNTAGAWAGAIAAQLGEPVPVEAGGLMLMITHRVAPFVRPVLGATGRALSFKQFDNGTVLIGGGLRCAADAQAGHGEVDMLGLGASAQTVTALFPHLGPLGINRAWAGVEAFLPDQIPVIGPSRSAPDVVHAFGFSAHGFELGPIVGRIVADLVTEGRSHLPIDAFAVDRFDKPRSATAGALRD
ncbi:NAD(P)/FAD-dependent oxidoreductase [Cupriavidus taiwanensis]|uniref:Sarcosine oxidase beta subunit, FAD dependent oxidoreductase n=1 Tax=Cupriavidus taiwanensis (strain DSM 17343 / BCRC 17206 / CCUG 44338 / CIP 107171 / LMG 19424 / R1) TaxID=977880 RepID=B3RAH2_CUPTR|nr:FAD-binding oxidoreductase [Cupriavidus taiwanensis]CAQ71897.1 Sarcosine oxidase beta subunit, FAD dependent oxidoreductase [Cupriavidus taiwanensis LMG 19424]